MRTEPAFTVQTEQRPGLYTSMPAGDAVLVAEICSGDGVPVLQRRFTVADMGGMVDLAGLPVRDPDELFALADHLRTLGYRLMREHAHPYRPGTKEGRRREAGAAVGHLLDMDDTPILAGCQVHLHHPSTGAFLGTTRVDRVDHAAGVLFAPRTINHFGHLYDRGTDVVFPEDVLVASAPPTGT